MKRVVLAAALMALATPQSPVAQERTPKITVTCHPDPNPDMGMVCDYTAGQTQFSVIAVGHRLGAAVDVVSVQKGDSVLNNSTYVAVRRSTKSGRLTRYVCLKTGQIAESSSDCEIWRGNWAEEH